MIFLSPMAIYLFGLAGIIITFYFLKQKVPQKPVSALFLWQKFTEKPKSALRFFWSSLFLLILQLLALALLVGALANPVFYIQASGHKRIAILIDGSLSMQAKTVSKFTSSQVRKSQMTRYDEAVAKAIEIINANPAAQITVIQAQAQSTILSPLSHKRSEAIEALRRSKPTFQGDARFKELLELLKSQAPIESFDKMVYLTDHSPKDELFLDLQIELLLVGAQPAAAPPLNVGITSFAVRRQPSRLASLQVDKLTSGEYSVLVTLENFSSEKVVTPLKISANDEIVSEAEIVIEAEDRVNHELSYSGSAKLFKAEISLEDDLEADNVRYFALPNPPKARILWLGDENPFLRAALSVLGEFEFQSAASPEKFSEYDLIVAYNARLTQSIEGNLFLINSELPHVVEFTSADKELTEWSVKAADHVVLEGIDPDELFVAPFQKAKVSERGQVIVTAKTDSDEYPLLYLYEDEKRRLVWLGLDLRYANSVLSLEFPILIKNMISWLLPWLYGETTLTIGDGIWGAGLALPIQMITPQGQIIKLNERKAFLETKLPGFYLLMAQDHLLTYAVNPPPLESDLRLGPPPPAKKISEASMPEFQVMNPLWPMLVLVGLLILILELYFYEPSLWRLRRGRR